MSSSSFGKMWKYCCRIQRYGKKPSSLLLYDENDGYFDHVPLYIVPNPYKENMGKVSQGIDPKLDFATRDQQTNPSTMESSIR